MIGGRSEIRPCPVAPWPTAHYNGVAGRGCGRLSADRQVAFQAEAAFGEQLAPVRHELGDLPTPPAVGAAIAVVAIGGLERLTLGSEPAFLVACPRRSRIVELFMGGGRNSASRRVVVGQLPGETLYPPAMSLAQRRVPQSLSDKAARQVFLP